MAGLMKTIMTDPGLRDRLSEKAKLRVLAYDWAQPAHALRAAVDRVSRNPAEYPQRQPLVSIVMPTRNHAVLSGPPSTACSIRITRTSNFWLWMASRRNNTVEILKSYGDRIRWISEPDKGQTDAINKGTALLKGEILAYLNSDDILLPGAIERLCVISTSIRMRYGLRQCRLYRCQWSYHGCLQHGRIQLRAPHDRLLRLPARIVLAAAHR